MKNYGITLYSHIMTCTAILKSGPNKGKACGKKKCLHQIEKEKEVVVEKVSEVEVLEKVSEVEILEKVSEVEVLEKVSEENVVEVLEKVLEKVVQEKVVEKVVEIVSTCKSIMKSGINKGKECGKKNCKLHKNVAKEEIQEEKTVQISVVSDEISTNESEKKVKETKEKKVKESKKDKKEIPLKQVEIPLEKQVELPIKQVEIQLEKEKTETLPLETEEKMDKIEKVTLCLEREKEEFKPEHRISVKEMDIKKIREHIFSQHLGHHGCIKKLKNGFCRNYPMNGHKTCFVHTLKNPSDDLQGFNSDSSDDMENVRFCVSILTVGKYKGFRCGNECKEGQDVCVFH